MKKKLHQIILLLLVGWIPALGQANHHCQAIMPPHFDPKSHYDLDPVETKGKKIRRLDRGNSNSKLVFEVHMHFVSKNGSESPMSKEDIDELVVDLNNAFYGADIQFEVKHSVISNSDFSSFNKGKEAAIHRRYHKNKVINVYCVDEIDEAQWRNDPGIVSGYAYHPDASGVAEYQRDMIILTYSGLDEQTTKRIFQVTAALAQLKLKVRSNEFEMPQWAPVGRQSP